MEARAEHWLRENLSHLRAVEPTVGADERVIPAGVACGITGGLAMAAPVVLYGWIRDAHSALELPMAATAWLFGLDHFAQDGYRWWPIVIGAAVLGAYFALHGVAYAFLEQRLRTFPEAIVGGLMLAFTSWLLFWYVVLPIARDGAPFRETAVAAGFVAPTWVWILGFTAFGVVTGVGHRAMRHLGTSRGTA